MTEGRGYIAPSATVEWATPEDVFRQLDEEFHFTLDPCCTHENAKCEKHYTKEDNGLSQDWGGRLSTVIHLTAGFSPIGSRRPMTRR